MNKPQPDPITSAVIRYYQTDDRALVQRIAVDTAYFGEPVDAFLEDRQVFTDAFTAYYIEFEPEHCWVACVEDRLVGYLLGSVNTEHQQTVWRRKIIPKVLLNAVRGRYRFGERTLSYVLGLAWAAARHELPQVDLQEYPAHLHINVNRRWRGLGLGRQLLESYFRQLRSLGIPGVHLRTTSQNQAACHLYESVGFRLIERRSTRLWTRWLDTPIENRCYGMQL